MSSRRRLAALHNYLQLVERDAAGLDDASRRYLAGALEQSRYLGDLAARLFDVSLIRHGRVVVQRDPVELRGLLATAVEEVRLLHPEVGAAAQRGTQPRRRRRRPAPAPAGAVEPARQRRDARRVRRPRGRLAPGARPYRRDHARGSRPRHPARPDPGAVHPVRRGGARRDTRARPRPVPRPRDHRRARGDAVRPAARGRRHDGPAEPAARREPGDRARRRRSRSRTEVAP